MIVSFSNRLDGLRSQPSLVLLYLDVHGWCAAAKASASGPFATASANAKAVATCAASPVIAPGQSCLPPVYISRLVLCCTLRQLLLCNNTL